MAVKAWHNYPAPAIVLAPVTNTNAAVTLDGSACLAWRFIPVSSPFVGGVLKVVGGREYFGTATGSPKITPYIYSDNFPLPGTVLTNGTGVQTGTLSSNGFVSFAWTGTLPSLTIGTPYWLVLKLTSGTSISANFTYAGSNQDVQALGIIGTNTIFGRSIVASGVDGVWAGTQYSGAGGYRLDVTDGTDTAYMGYPCNAYSAFSDVSSRIDGTQKVGIGFLTPALISQVLRTITFNLRKAGTPGDLTCSVYLETSSTALATSQNTVLASAVSTGGRLLFQFDFEPAVRLYPNTIYRIALSAASGSNSTDYHYLHGPLSDTDANTIYVTGWKSRRTTLSGTTWTDATNGPPSCIFIPDAATPWYSGVIINPGLSGGLR